MKHQHSLMAGESLALYVKLCSSKFIELDMSGRPLFTNPVTYSMWSNAELSTKANSGCFESIGATTIKLWIISCNGFVLLYQMDIYRASFGSTVLNP